MHLLIDLALKPIIGFAGFYYWLELNCQDLEKI